MPDSGTLALLLPAPIRRFPADLTAVLVSVVLTVLSVFLPVVSETPLRVVFGLAFVLFLPGYAFIAALFPEAGASPASPDDTDDADERRRSPPSAGSPADDETLDVSGSGSDGDADSATPTAGGIDGIERVALSFGTSIAITPLIGLVLNFTPFGIRLVPVVLSLAVFTTAAAIAAAYRRQALPEVERFRVPYREWAGETRTELFEPDSGADAALNVLLVLSVLVAAGSVAYAVTVPQSGERFTELYLLTESEDGDLIADDYPQNFTVGESKPVVVGVTNQEHRPENYSVVVELQSVTRVQTDNNSTRLRVTDETELRRFRTGRLGHNETWQQTYNIAPTTTGDRLRLTFLLYRGDPPENPTVENAYREVHLFVNVSR